MKKEISVLYEKIYKNRINALKESPEAYVKRKVLIDKIKDDIEDAYSEGKITELHYNILNERISKMISEDDNHDSS